MHGVDYIFHAAALKQVPSCEFFPLEAVKTNVIGTDNVLTAAIDAEVKSVICLSTDKAAYPVNAMGTSKAMMEKVIVAKIRTVSPERTEMLLHPLRKRPLLPGQRGAPVDRPDKGGQAPHHHGAGDDPVRHVSGGGGGPGAVRLRARGQRGHPGAERPRRAPSPTLAQAVAGAVLPPAAETRVIGIRHGEKLYETLLTNEECAHAIDLGNFYRVPCDKRDLNYDKYFKEGDHPAQRRSRSSTATTRSC